VYTFVCMCISPCVLPCTLASARTPQLQEFHLNFNIIAVAVPQDEAAAARRWRLFLPGGRGISKHLFDPAR
jgi:hypothetical protein